MGAENKKMTIFAAAERIYKQLFTNITPKYD
jgi:hypothetical protein